MPEAALFSRAERFPVPIDQIAAPADIAIFGDHFGEATYYADYAGIARKYGPRSILEIGVRYGYSGLALCLGARAFGHPKVYYTGLDAEFCSALHHHPDDCGAYRSNAVAGENFRRCAPFVTAEFLLADTRHGLPISVAGGTAAGVTYTPGRYDLINVDGDHGYEGALDDCRQTWPLLRPGGIMLVDDMSFAHVRPAVIAFIAERERAGETIFWQEHENERGLMLLRRDERSTGG